MQIFYIFTTLALISILYGDWKRIHSLNLISDKLTQIINKIDKIIEDK